jgi:hypothetical protein
MTPKLLYAGFDSVYVALQGALPAETIEVLRKAREAAAERHEPILVSIGLAGEEMHLAPGGLSGGYAFRADTGPIGEMLAFKENNDPQEWNGFASIHASTLAALGFRAAREQLFARLARMGFAMVGHSVNRIDYAADFLTQGFELRPDGFVAHPRIKRKVYWSDAANDDSFHPSAVLAGRRVEAMTIGKMPGRQVIVYDKRAEAIAKRKLFWFKKWGIDPADEAAEVTRVEVRAGKKALKDRWHLHTFDDVDRAIGDVILAALDEVRYVAPLQRDSNVSRHRLDPLWQAMIAHVEYGLSDFRAGLLPSDVREVERQNAIDTYSAQALGNIAGLAVAEGMDDRAIEARLAIRLARMINAALSDRRGKFQRSIDRARERLYFVCDHKR